MKVDSSMKWNWNSNKDSVRHGRVFAVDNYQKFLS